MTLPPICSDKSVEKAFRFAGAVVLGGSLLMGVVSGSDIARADVLISPRCEYVYALLSYVNATCATVSASYMGSENSTFRTCTMFANLRISRVILPTTVGIDGS